jgi:hypothetical protein
MKILRKNQSIKKKTNLQTIKNGSKVALGAAQNVILFLRGPLMMVNLMMGKSMPSF